MRKKKVHMLLGVLEIFCSELLLPLSTIDESTLNLPLCTKGNPDVPVSCTNLKQQFKEPYCKGEIFVLFSHFLTFKNVEETI